MKHVLSLIIMISLSANLFSQGLVQTIYGKVLDEETKEPLEFAIVKIKDDSIYISIKTNNKGEFEIQNIPLGRYDLLVTYVSYEPEEIKEIQLTSAKEKEINVMMRHKRGVLKETVIHARVQKEKTMNEMTLVSGRMLNMEEARRYAGGFDDPARLVTSFAGTAGGTANNAIVIRGNAPKSLQWKIEGIEVPNPNHFADLGAFGGGGITALSAQLLSNSDFISGAFTAEYTNALSGVFDLRMRNGNYRQREHTVQVGAIGIDLATEGPFSSRNNASYLVNYRYSTLGLIQPLLPDNSEGTKYQDLSFKINVPTKIGLFSLWGIGLKDQSGQNVKRDSSLWKYETDKDMILVEQYMGAGGLMHKYLINNSTALQTTVASTLTNLSYKGDRLDANLIMHPWDSIMNKNLNLIFKTELSKQFGDKHFNKTGVQYTGLFYNMLIKNSYIIQSPLNTVVNEKNNSYLLSAYTASKFSLSNSFTLNIGLSAQMFGLNQKKSIEPRLSMDYKLGAKSNIAFGYGLHSRLEKINFYLTKEFGQAGNYINKDLDFTKAHHWVLSYNYKLNENLNFKMEPYFQYLFSVPVIPDSSYSFINLQSEWFLTQKLSNEGKGRNYGIEFTLEKYMTKGLYYLITLSIFDSKYRGGDKIWRNTMYNKNYLSNLLIGKEWGMGRKKVNVFGASVRLSYQGGNRYTPYDKDASKLMKSVVYDYSNPFSAQLKPDLLLHLTVLYKINRKKVAHEFALKILNATMVKDFEGFKYNYQTGEVDNISEALLLPNISYKLDFSL